MRIITIFIFTSAWCEISKLNLEVLSKLKNNEKNINFKLYQVKEENSIESLKKFNIKDIPTILIFVNSTEVKRFVGYTSAENIINFLKNDKKNKVV